MQTRNAPVRANSFNAETRTFDAVIASTSPVIRADFNGPYREVLDLSGELPESIPLLNGHRASGAGDIVGRVSNLRREGDSIVATIRLSGREEVRGIVSDIADGIVTDLSIGYGIRKTTASEENGERVKTVIPDIREASIVPIGADQTAKVRTMTPQLQDRIRSIAEVAGLGNDFIEDQIARNATEAETRQAALAAMETRGTTTAQIRAPHNQATMDNPEVRRDAMADALASRIAGTTPTEAAREYLGENFRSFEDFARDILERSGQRTHGLRGAKLISRAYTTTTDFPAFLTEVGNRTIMPRFESLLSPVVTLARRKTATDFRSFSELRLGTDMRLDPLNETGEFKRGNFVESKESMRIGSFGKTFALSFNAIANDDLGAFSQVSADLAQAAANTVNDLVINLILANPRLSDGTAVFAAGRGNLATGAGSALSETSLRTAVIAMKKRTGIAGERIMVRPTELVVSPDREFDARKLLATIAPQTTTDVNVFAGAFNLHVEPRFDGNAWYLIDPSLGDLVDAYLSGYEGPQVQTREGWDTLGTEWRVHLHYGTAFMGWRGWYRAAGA